MNRRIKRYMFATTFMQFLCTISKKRSPPTTLLITHTMYRCKNSFMATHQCYKTIIPCIGTYNHQYLKYLFSVPNYQYFWFKNRHRKAPPCLVISLANQTAVLSVRPECGSGYRTVLPHIDLLFAPNKAAYSGTMV